MFPSKYFPLTDCIQLRCFCSEYFMTKDKMHSDVEVVDILHNIQKILLIFITLIELCNVLRYYVL